MHLLANTTNHSPPDERCARAVMEGLPSAMWFIRKQMRRHRAHGLSVPQLRVLGMLDRFPDASLSCIAEHLGCTMPTASRLVTGLVDKRLVDRRESRDDRRQVVLRMTVRGRDAMQTSRRATIKCLASKMGALNDTQRTTVKEAMGLLQSMFDNPEPTANGEANSRNPRIPRR